MKKLMSIFSIFGAMAAVSCNNVELGPDEFMTPAGEKVSIHPIKHGSFSMQVGEKWFYVDPVGEGLEPVTDYSVMPKADYILVTHEHFDHLDVKAIADLYKEGTQIVVNKASFSQVAPLTAPRQVIFKMSNGDTAALTAKWSVAAVPAYNYSEEKLGFHPEGRDNGYVLDLDGFKVYIGGDTEDIPEMSAVKDIDVAFLPCNLPYTMTPEQCANAARMISPKVLYPYHYGDTDIERVVELLKDSSVEVRIRDFQ